MAPTNAKARTRPPYRVRQSAVVLRNLMENSATGVALAALDGRVVHANSAFATMLGYAPDECVGLGPAELIHADDVSVAREQLDELTRGEVASNGAERRFLRKDGTVLSGRMSVSLARDERRGTDLYLVLQLEDIEKQKRAESARAEIDTRWDVALQVAGQGVWDVDYLTGTVFYSRRWREMRGIGLDEQVDGSRDAFYARLHPDDRARIQKQVERQVSGEVPVGSLEYRELHRDGHYIWILSRGGGVQRLPNGQPTRSIGTDTEITSLKEKEAADAALAAETYRSHLAGLEKAHEAAEAAQQLAQSLARHDALTGLPNRRVFAEAMESAVARANRGAGVFAILIFDLDRFKPINDLHGHAIGDFVLGQIATRLGEVVRKSDTLARIGGDEFGVILECAVNGETAADAARRLAARIIEAVSLPITQGDQSYSVGASVGIAMIPADGSDPETLLRAADMAMYRAKEDGRGALCFFQPSMEADLRARVVLEEDVRQAVAAEDIKPFYQPLIQLSDKKLIGFEILARWHHPVRGGVPPDTFIPIIEKLGLISQFTYSLLRRACLDARDWSPEITLALNISPLHFTDPLLPVKLLAILSETGFSPGRLEIELTENALMKDIDAARAVLVALQGLGIKISLDDFGTGYASLYHLRELRFDKIKIDRSFVQAMETDIESAKIVQSVIALAKSLGLPTIAEGIEHVGTMNQVIEGGAEYGQGYYFGKAMPAAEAAKLARAPTAGLPGRLTA